MPTDSANCGGDLTLTLYNHKPTKNLLRIPASAAYICVPSNAVFLAEIPFLTATFWVERILLQKNFAVQSLGNGPIEKTLDSIVWILRNRV